MKIVLRLLLGVAMLFVIAWADRAIGAREVRAAKVFVQEFYDWYSHTANDMTATVPAWDAVVASRASSVDSTFLRLLQQDLAVRSQNPGEIAGLDGDPFLNTQDPCNTYRADSVRVVQAQFRVAVSGDCTYSEPIALDVVLERRRGKWILVNVRDANGYDAVATMSVALRPAPR